MSDPLASKLPVTLVTGFLGSGKTTLISRLVKHPDMNRVAVVINEIGEIGIDHDLVTLSSENITLLANGCICCSVRTDLQETLRELFAQRRAGLVADFDRVIVETTGLADPAPVIQTLVSDTLLAAQYRLDGVVTLIDTVVGAQQLRVQPEAAKQVALADRVFMTKGDLACANDAQLLRQAITAINRNASIASLVNGEIEPSELINLGLSSARVDSRTLSFLGEPLTYDDHEDHADHANLADHVSHSNLSGDASSGRYLGTRKSAHDPAIKTVTLRFSASFSWASFSSALDLLATLRGPDLLRVKGIVNVDGHPVVVQGVQHIFHPPVTLDRWPSADTDTRLVFITRNIAADTIRNLFGAVSAVSQLAAQPAEAAAQGAGAAP